MSQVGIYSASQLQLHDHYDWSSGGPILSITRADAATVQRTLNNTQQTNNLAWTLMKRILVLENSAGLMRIIYTLRITGTAGTAHAQARILRAGSPIWNGNDNTEVAGPTTFTDSAIAIDLQAQDVIDIYGYNSVGGTSYCDIRTMQLGYTMNITNIARHVITTGVVCTTPVLMQDILN